MGFKDQFCILRLLLFSFVLVDGHLKNITKILIKKILMSDTFFTSAGAKAYHTGAFYM